jgi:hypothetical protein
MLADAQHVVLVEPLLDPAVEAQAVGRVHRIGQTDTTVVHRFVVEASVEENVHRLCQQRASAMDLSAAPVRGQAEAKSLSVRWGHQTESLEAVTDRPCQSSEASPDELSWNMRRDVASLLKVGWEN